MPFQRGRSSSSPFGSDGLTARERNEQRRRDRAERRQQREAKAQAKARREAEREHEAASEQHAHAVMAENDETRVRDEVAAEERLNARFQKFHSNGEPVHKGCQWCGTMYSGPHKDKLMRMEPAAAPGERPKPREMAADEERMYTAEELQTEVEREGASTERLDRFHNIGGSVCPDCYAGEAANYRQNYSQAQLDAARERVREEDERRRQRSGDGA